jgi:hypothetical protein
MSTPGIGVIINELIGHEDTVRLYNESLGKKIIEAELDKIDNRLIIAFEDGNRIAIFDDGQSCCENRYMTTDDDLLFLANTKLVDIQLEDAPNVEDEFGEHEVQFLIIKTDKGDITLETHNEHNGYYGGFAVVIKEAGG